VHNSVHNIYMQALVGGGIVGLLSLILVTLYAPLRLFYDRCNIGSDEKLIGLITVISYSIFGLTESWTMRLSASSVFIVYIVIIAAHLKVRSTAR